MKFAQAVAPGYELEAETNPDGRTLTLRLTVRDQEVYVCTAADWELVEWSLDYLTRQVEADNYSPGNPVLGLWLAAGITLLLSPLFWLGWALCR